MRTGAQSHRWLKMTKRCELEVAHHKPFFRCLFDRLPVQTVTSDVHHPIVRGKSDQSFWLIGMQFFFNLCRWKTFMSHDGRKRILFWSNNRNAFCSCFSPQLIFFYEKLYQGSNKNSRKKPYLFWERNEERMKEEEIEKGVGFGPPSQKSSFFFCWYLSDLNQVVPNHHTDQSQMR